MAAQHPVHGTVPVVAATGTTPVVVPGGAAAPVVATGGAPSIGLFPQHQAQVPTALVVKERKLSIKGDDFKVKDVAGNTICKVDGKTLSIHGTKDFLDAHGKKLFTLKKKLVSIHGAYEATAPDGRVLFEVKGKFKIVGSKMVASFTNASDGKPIEITVKGDWIDRKAQMIVDKTGYVVANVTRHLATLKEAVMDRQTYYVEVAPGVDLVLIAAIAVAFDEQNNDDD